MQLVNRPGVLVVHLALLMTAAAPGCRSTSTQVEDTAPTGVMQCKGDDAHPNCLCDDNADCTFRPGGVCSATPGNLGVDLGIARSCTYPECSGDADCGEGAFCQPPGTTESVARCIRATCRDDRDCTDGGVAGACRLLGTSTTGQWESHCVSADDPCDVDRPCDAAPPNEHGYRAPRVCFFVNGTATCVVDEGPPRR